MEKVYINLTLEGKELNALAKAKEKTGIKSNSELVRHLIVALAGDKK
jgi:hypothetical protein